jgi:HEAT repeat protein
MTRLAVLLAAALALAACTRQEQRDRDLRSEVAVIATREGPLAEAAIQEVKQYGREAIPPIEAALPTVSTTGRLNLVWALRVIGDAEAVPLLAHVALHDEDEAVRAEAETTLRTWAEGRDERAARAVKALRQLEEQRGTGKSG